MLILSKCVFPLLPQRKKASPVYCGRAHDVLCSLAKFSILRVAYFQRNSQIQSKVDTGIIPFLYFLILMKVRKSKHLEDSICEGNKTKLNDLFNPMFNAFVEIVT